jgi:hypothetical protein
MSPILFVFSATMQNLLHFLLMVALAALQVQSTCNSPMSTDLLDTLKDSKGKNMKRKDLQAKGTKYPGIEFDRDDFKVKKKKEVLTIDCNEGFGTKDEDSKFVPNMQLLCVDRSYMLFSRACSIWR